MVCSLWVLSDVLGWERLREAGGNPAPFPPDVHSFLPFYTPKLSLSPVEMNRGSWTTRKPSQLTKEPLKDKQTHHQGGAGAGLYLPAGREQRQLLNQQGGLRRVQAASANREAGRAGTGMLSFRDASQDRLFRTAPSSGMCLINKSHLPGAGWDSSFA